jgi:hypothetical protein
MAYALLNHKANLSRAQTEQTNATPCCGQPHETQPREIDFPYYSLRDGFSSTVFLVSDSPKPLDFVMAVRGLSGQTVLAPAMTIQPQEKLSIDLRKLLSDAGADLSGDFGEGSVAIYFNGTIMPLAGQLTMTDPARGLILESEMVDNSPSLGLLPNQLNGLWWGIGAGRDARIMVSNTSADSVLADVYLDVLGERHSGDLLQFAPHETKVLSITKLLAGMKLSSASAPEGGISIIARGNKPTLIAQGKITDSATGFSTSLNFLDPSLQLASALHASGVPIGIPAKGSPFAGTGTFVPHVIVRNLDAAPQAVTLTIESPAQDGPQQTVLPPLPLAPYATNDISLDSVSGLLPLPLPFCSIRIQYSGPPGSVVGEVSSIEVKGDLVIDSRLANEGDGWAGSGAHPWHLDEETESILFLTNMGDKEVPIGFMVTAQDVHYYLTKLRLAPHETKAIDLRKLRDAQEPGYEGVTIPAGATDGSVNWVRADNVPVMGRLVVLQRHKGMASNYDCATCPCPMSYLSLFVTPSTATVIAGGTYQLNDTITVQNCNDSPYRIQGTDRSSWSSDSASVCTVTSGPNSWGVVTGVAGGTCTITASHSGLSCLYNPNWHPYPCACTGEPLLKGTATVTVQKPNSLSVLSVKVLPTGTTGDYGCVPGYDYGIAVDIKYQVLDQRNPPQAIMSSNMIPHEKGTFSDGTPYDNNIGPTYISTTSKNTAADGTFHDAPMELCSIAPFSGKTQTQNVTVLIGSGSYPVRSQTFTYSSSGAGHGTITNGSDISASR